MWEVIMMYAYLGRERDGTASNIATSHIKIINQSFVIPICITTKKEQDNSDGSVDGGVCVCGWTCKY